ncbi:MAG TPA: NADH-quinone oxidoreductase subunit C [Acidobacteriota bacterium]|jgi:NADH-quinone oxidoreductase subunit C|nr:NADH-quinone oxidoreductase subunit C [Acidobacteriota bacterium]
MEPSITLRKLKDNFGTSLFDLGNAFGDDFAVVHKDKNIDVARFLRDDAELKYNYLIDITAVDYPKRRPRFEVVYHFFSLLFKHRVRIKAPIEEKDAVLPSLVPLWQGADWFEREVWDMFGIRFSGHPDLRRILMYDGFEGHPLRKDYPINKRQPLIGPKN